MVMDESTPQLRTTAVVRRADESDVTLLALLGARLFEQAFGAANNPDDIADYVATAFSVEALRNVVLDADCASWIAEDPGRAAIGYAILRRGTTANGITSDRPAEVQRIYVERAWHGRNVGEALMRACIDHAQRVWHADELWLGVWQDNPRAITFYEKSGFRVVGEQTFQLGSDVQKDFVMSRALR
jgi:ribosomal protein S18 acetylase RimI-like enzyme